MVGDFLSGLLRDLGGFLRDAVWNRCIAVYAGIVVVWATLAEFQRCLRGPEECVGLVSIVALVLGAFMAYRAARQGWLWDTTALQVEDWTPSQPFLQEPVSRRYGSLLIAEARKVIPSPTRVRIVLTGKPTAIEAEVQRTKPETRLAVELNDRTDLRCKIRGRRVYLQFSNPPLSVSDRQLIISILSKEPLSYKSIAAWRNRD